MNGILPWTGKRTGHLDLSRAVSTAELDGAEYAVNWRKNGDVFTAEVPGARFECRIGTVPGGVRIACRAVLERAVGILKLHLLRFPALKLDHYAGCGEKMGRAQSVRFPAEEETPLRSFHNCVLTSGGESVVLSTPLRQSYDNCFTGRAAGELLLDFRLTYELRPGGLADPEFDPVTAVSGDPFEILRDYAEENAGGGRDLAAPPACGWNSWDDCRWTVTEDEVIRNAEFIASDPVLSRHVKRIIVDDGWQYCYGEWEPNHLFPSGMKSLARRLEKLGFTPGLWLAPAIVEPQSRIAQLERGMLAMSRGGQPCLSFECMRRHGFVLDPTVPASQRFIEALFDRYAAMGFGYFKLDFLAGLLTAGRFHDGSVPRCRLVGKLLESVRAGIAGRAKLLGCNFPFACGSGFVTSVRTASDIHAAWPQIRRNAVSAAYMFWANGTLWQNDPDFALCRGPETSCGPASDRLDPLFVFVRPEAGFMPEVEDFSASMTLEEARVLLSVVLMAGGAVNLSDRMYLLNASGLDLARRTVSATPARAAVPLDLFTSDRPVYWFQQTDTGHRLLVVNWQDGPGVFPLPWEKCGGRPAQVRDFWTDAVGTPPAAAELAPRTCRLWEF